MLSVGSRSSAASSTTSEGPTGPLRGSRSSSGGCASFLIGAESAMLFVCSGSSTFVLSVGSGCSAVCCVTSGGSTASVEVSERSSGCFRRFRGGISAVFSAACSGGGISRGASISSDGVRNSCGGDSRDGRGLKKTTQEGVVV